MIAVRVAVVGGGVGGLCLAQGLRRSGVDVSVYERDPGLDTRRQGYRIHLDARAARALHECLPDDVYELFRRTLGIPGSAFTVVDEQLKVLHRTVGVARDPRTAEPEQISAPADRRTLRHVTGDFDADSAAESHRLAAAAISGWHQDLRALVDRADVDETFLIRVSTSEPTPAWTPGRITVLGDAIHAMSPAGGSGANTALMDAALLRSALVRADRGEQPLFEAIGEYENRMRAYGYAAVAAADQSAGELWAQRHPVLARSARLLGRFARLRGRLARLRGRAR